MDRVKVKGIDFKKISGLSHEFGWGRKHPINFRSSSDLIRKFTVIVLIGGFFVYSIFPSVYTLAATTTFTQTSWAGGATANIPADSTDQTGWTEYGSKDANLSVVNAGADLQLGLTSGSATQTNDTDFNAGTHSTTVTSGSGDSADVVLASDTRMPWTKLTNVTDNIDYGGDLVSTGDDYIYALTGKLTLKFRRYSISGNSWSNMQDILGTVGYGGALVYPGSGDYIYALRGNTTTDFYRYSISANSWSVRASITTAVKYGGTLVSTGDDYIYAFSGNATTNFYRYSISGNSWTTMSPVTGTIGSGADLLYTGSGDYLYALRGANTTDFYRYSISVDSWSTLTSTPDTGRYGGSLAYPGSGDTIYRLRGNINSGFNGYSISVGNWSTLTRIPTNAYYGGSLVYPGSGVYLYGAPGGNSNSFYRYNINQEGGWSAVADYCVIAGAGSSVYDGDDYIYTSQGSTADFCRYSISGNSWTPMADFTAIPGSGNQLVYPGSGDYIYYLRGGATTDFYRYSISGNSWTSLAVATGVIDYGGGLVYPGSGDYLYALAGGGTANFYRYSISADTWSTRTSVTAVINTGGAIVSTGDDYIYVAKGSSATFYRYSIVGNSWATMANTKSNFAGGSSLAYTGSGDYIYGIPGGGNANFYAYSIANNAWFFLPYGTETFSGSSLVAAGDYLYTPRGSTVTYYKFFLNAYSLDGVFTSSVIDLSADKVFSTLSYTATTPASTVFTIDARAGDSDPVDGTWTSWSTGISNGGDISGLGTHRYFQYRINLSTTDNTATSSLSDMTVNYSQYASSQTLTSSSYNTETSTVTFDSLAWIEDSSLPSNTTVTVSLRTASTSGGLSGASWSDFTAGTSNCSKVSGTVTCTSDAIPSAMKDGSGDQWVQYKIALATSDGVNTATLSQVQLGYITNTAPNVPSSLGPSGLVDGSINSSVQPELTFTLSDPDSSDTVKYQIQIDDTSDFSSVVVDYTSALAVQGATSFTVGQAVGSGSYTAGSESQSLTAGSSYYWRVKTIDSSSASSAYVTANSGNVAFSIDGTAPTISNESVSVTDTGAIITWRTNESASSIVDYGLTDSYGTSTSETDTSPRVVSHTVTLSGLTSCTAYNYRVRSRDATANEGIGSNKTFTTVGCPSGAVIGYSTKPLEPLGLVINDGINLTESSLVDLTLTYGANVANVAISNYPNFDSASLEVVRQEIPWNLCYKQNRFITLPAKECAVGQRVVYLKFYTKHGQSSAVYADSIAFHPRPTIGSEELPASPVSSEAVAGLDVVSGADVSRSRSFVFDRNLYLRSRGEDVLELQKYLNKHGFILASNGPGAPGKETHFFGWRTLAAVINFQEAHRKEILEPIGLVKGTGYFGPMTRAFVGKISP